MRIERAINMGVSLHNTTNKSNISYKHNNREITSGNKDIDLNRIDDNIYYVQGAKNLEKWVNNEFVEAVEKYNAKQKRSDRKIGNMYEKLLKDKKVTLEREMIVQVGDKSNFWNGDGSRNEKYWDLAKEVMDQYANSFQERNPNFRVYNMTLHLDEASPHLHINYLPVYHSERGLEKRVSWEKAAAEQGIKPTIGSKERKNKETGEIEKYQGIIESAFQKWRDKETGFIERLLRDREVGRHKAGSHKHMSVPEYKEMVNELEEIKQEIDELDNDFIDLEEEISELKDKRSELASKALEDETKVNVLKEKQGDLERKSERLKGVLETYRAEDEMYSTIRYQKFDIDRIEVIEQKKREGFKKVNTGKVEINKKDWEAVKDLAIHGKAFQIENINTQSQNYRLLRENERLEKDNEQLQVKNEMLNVEKKELNTEIQNLTSENSRFKQVIEVVNKFIAKFNLMDKYKEFNRDLQREREERDKELAKQKKFRRGRNDNGLDL